MVSMAKQSLNANKILIIVGGNSVAMGRGQGKDLWTETLQRKLGPKYKVLNLAQSGMPAFTGPYIAFLTLYEKYKNVCYVAVGQDLYVNYLDEPFQGYPYWWDAYFKGLLPNVWQLAMFMNERHLDDTSSQREETAEIKIESFLDSMFYFEDLWSTIGYKSFFTVWTAPTAATFLKPRIDYEDVDPPPPPVEIRFTSLNFPMEHNETTQFLEPVLEHDKTTHKLQLSKSYLDFFKQAMQATVPEQARSRVLLLRVRENPAIAKQALSEDELDCMDRASEVNQKMWKKIGCRVLLVGKDYGPEDYLDGNHLSGSGGAKLAEAVSVKIGELIH
ncbi:MAG: hypothetical protein HYX67_16175 [Candidatus Melainabacteria bacterium]|nr:hypothetical protein [Candidatus Melainabacteria bacterium]